MSWFGFYLVGVGLVALWSLGSQSRDRTEDIWEAMWLGVWWPVFALAGIAACVVAVGLLGLWIAWRVWSWGQKAWNWCFG